MWRHCKKCDALLRSICRQTSRDNSRCHAEHSWSIGDMIEACLSIHDGNVYHINNATRCLSRSWIDQTSLRSHSSVAETSDSHHQPTVSSCNRRERAWCPWTMNWVWPRDIRWWWQKRHAVCHLFADERRRFDWRRQDWMLEYDRQRWCC